jgi:hypothetical protein
VIHVSLERIAGRVRLRGAALRVRGERTQLDDWAEHKGPDGLRAYRARNNAKSIDGLPGLDP